MTGAVTTTHAHASRYTFTQVQIQMHSHGCPDTRLAASTTTYMSYKLPRTFIIKLRQPQNSGIDNNHENARHRCCCYWCCSCCSCCSCCCHMMEHLGRWRRPSSIPCTCRLYLLNENIYAKPTSPFLPIPGFLGQRLSKEIATNCTLGCD